MNHPVSKKHMNLCANPLKISIVIPVLNEAQRVNSAIERAWQCGADEVVVVDGGSEDETASLAKEANCQFCQSMPGRGIQLNAGALVTTGDILLFLHVDNWFEAEVASQIRDAMENEACIGGGFQQKIGSPRSIFRFVEKGNLFRARTQRLVYGDQGLFVRKEFFNQLGGFPEIPLMEDFELSQRLFKEHKPVLLDGPIHVSARGWEQAGVVKQTIKNWRIAAAYRRGASPADLYQRYYKQ